MKYLINYKMFESNENLLDNLFKDMEIYENRELYPDWVFWIKHIDGKKKAFMMHDESNDLFLCDFEDVWQTVKKVLNIKEEHDLVKTIKNEVESRYNVKIPNPMPSMPFDIHTVVRNEVGKDIFY